MNIFRSLIAIKRNRIECNHKDKNQRYLEALFILTKSAESQSRQQNNGYKISTERGTQSHCI